MHQLRSMRSDMAVVHEMMHAAGPGVNLACCHIIDIVWTHSFDILHTVCYECKHQVEKLPPKSNKYGIEKWRK